MTSEQWLRRNRGKVWTILLLGCAVFWMAVYRLFF